jgi:hypothetical protein
MLFFDCSKFDGFLNHKRRANEEQSHFDINSERAGTWSGAPMSIRKGNLVEACSSPQGLRESDELHAVYITGRVPSGSRFVCAASTGLLTI